jgi:hypothetical protein
VARRTFLVRTDQTTNGRTPSDYFQAYDTITNKYFALGMEPNTSYGAVRRERDYVTWSIEMTGQHAESWAREIDQFFGSCVKAS